MIRVEMNIIFSLVRESICNFVFPVTKKAILILIGDISI